MNLPLLPFPLGSRTGLVLVFPDRRLPIVIAMLANYVPSFSLPMQGSIQESMQVVVREIDLATNTHYEHPLFDFSFLFFSSHSAISS